MQKKNIVVCAENCVPSVSRYIHIISATDSSGGAGMPLDVRMAADMGYWPVCTVSGVTSQSFDRVYSVSPVEDRLFQEQLELALDYDIPVVKIGALFSLNQLKMVLKYLNCFTGTVVYDPVFGPSGGDSFYTSEMIEYLVTTLMHKIDVLTPNRSELERIWKRPFNSVEESAEYILNNSSYKTTFCLKGGHYGDADVLEGVVNKKIEYSKKNRKKIAYSHGSGCMLSILTACYIGKNIPVAESFFSASKKVTSVLQMYNKFIKQR